MFPNSVSATDLTGTRHKLLKAKNLKKYLKWLWHEKWPLYILVPFESLFEYKLNCTKFIEIETPVLGLLRIKILKWWRYDDAPLIRKTCQNDVFLKHQTYLLTTKVVKKLPPPIFLWEINFKIGPVLRYSWMWPNGCFSLSLHFSCVGPRMTACLLEIWLV